MKCWWPAAVATLLAPWSAKAETPPSEGLTVQTSMAALHTDRQRLSSTDASFADQVEGRRVHLDGDGLIGMIGFGGRRVFSSGLRVGIAGSAGGAVGLSLQHDPFQRYEVRRHRIWAAGIDLQGGWQFHAGPLWPYVELQLGARSLSTDMSIREIGREVVATRSEQAAVWSAALRGGVEIPVGECTYVDLALFGSPVGAIRYGGLIGVVWEHAGGCRARTDPAAALAREDTACKRGSAPDCVRAGERQLRKGQRDAALALFEAGCGQWSIDACMEAGRLAALRRDTVGERRARGSFAKACELGQTEACTRVAQGALQASPPDYAAARGVLERACQGRDAVACSQQAELVRGGWGGPRDAGYALKLHKYACEQCVSESCEKAAAMCERGEGGPKDAACVKWARGFFSCGPARGMTVR